ncbi:MAG TPA: HAMP domain-containing protein [Thiotrichaceae bacterium]|nr:HAMP domain-containing protein [Thiotrichaceae bacterium]
MNFFNNLKVGNKIITGYLAILLLMMGMVAMLVFSLNNLTKDFTFLVEHDQPVLANAHQLAKLLVDMEIGERGFLITGKDEFLELFQNGMAQFNTLIEFEKKLVSDNLAQVAVLEKIERLHNEWIQVAAKPEIAKRREANQATVSAESLQEMLKTGLGKGILDELRGVLDKMEVSTKQNDLESIILILKIAKDMLDQETGQRGFMSTGEDRFLEPYYHNGQAQLAKNIKALRTRLVDDSEQLALLKQVESLAFKWIEKAAKPEINVRLEMNANPVTMAYVSAMIQAGTGKALIDQIGTQFDTFIQTENELNTQRSDEAKQDVFLARTLSLGLTLGSLLIGLLLGISISRSITRPLGKLTDMGNKMLAGDLKQIADIQTYNDINQITSRQDEMGDIGRTYDALARYFRTVIEDIVQISQGLAKGNLRVRPQAEYKGDFVQIKHALETALSNLRLVTEDIVQVSQGLAAGNLRVKPTAEYGGDFLKIKQALEMTTSDLSQVIEDIVQVSQGLAEAGQNVTAQAEYRGDFIQIKNALEMAAAKLAEATALNAIQNWLKTGQTQLNEKIRGEQAVMTLSKNIITFLTTYLEAQVGVFYLLEEGERAKGFAQGKEEMSDRVRLKLVASYAYTQRKGMTNEFQIGEGLIGQAALEKQRIIVNEVPEDYIHIQSGLGEAVPQNLIVIPFIYENTVKGVIEIGSFHAITEIQLEFLDQVMPNIGISVNTADSRTKMQALLDQ